MLRYFFYNIIVYNHIFVDKHKFKTGEYKQFYPSYNMAQSWNHLISKDDTKIKYSDIIMLEHELYESILMEYGLTYEDAHEETNKIYNYVDELKKERNFYD